ncbi:MAG: cobalamin biosynthesis protein CobQ [Oscillospiraceae bacterium]|nr:cobalamin biosynthesis protein CobQ [Oscillospiraceae bacterium]
MDILREKTLIITGHYGSGKTNLAINLAKSIHSAGTSVTLADLDIVNPYFRTADFRQWAGREGIGLVSSDYAASGLDVPALSPAVDAQIGSKETTLIIDVGGDDAGAYALGRYAPRLKASGYLMVYVVNAFRLLTKTPEEALGLLYEIERASRLKAGCVVNNSNLSDQTTPEDVQSSVRYAQKIAEQAKIPLAMTSVRRNIYEKLADKNGFYPVDIYMKPPWAED